MTVDNSDKNSVKKKVVGRPFVKGQSGNPKGAPKRGMSWKEILEQVGNLDGEQALERAGRIFADLKKYPKQVTLKELSAIAYYIRMINDPNGSLLNAVADRTDGKVVQPVEGNIGLTWSEFVKTDEETDAE
jgi:hypothetical protein